VSRRTTTSIVAAVCVLAGRSAAATTLPANFQESTAFAGLTLPTVVKFAPDGRVFVAEKSGLVKVFASLSATTPVVFADLRSRVHDYWDRGLLGMAVDPAFPTRPYVYVLYALDKNPADPLATVPTWGDTCPSPPGPMASGCVVMGRLSRLDASAAWPVQSTEQVLIDAFPQQFPSHSVGALAFGEDGALYVSAGEGASFGQVDYGQFGGANGAGAGQRVPKNPAGDPPVGPGGQQTPPSARGGALRSQSLRRPPGEPVTLSGAILRVDPDTGAALPDNPLASAADVNARRIVGYGLRNPFRFALRPGTSEVWVGDVGWNQTEEIDRLDVSAPPSNFGWPCYEGGARQAGYEAVGLAACVSLYAEGSAREPHFTYAHEMPVVPGESCENGSSSIAGLAFYTTGGYPTVFEGALFFTDYTRKCIWTMLPDGSGAPDPSQVYPFAQGLSGGAVNLERGPGGDLFYVDFDGGRVQRFTYFRENQPPVAAATATPTGGPTPLLVRFDASGSSDADDDPITFAWDLDGDGAFDDSTLVNPSRTYTTPGRKTVRLRVRDSQGAASIAQVSIYPGNTPPVPAIVSPAAALAWSVGDEVSFAGTADDGEEGALPAPAFEWTLILNHCPASCHPHVVESWNDVAFGSFSAPDHEYPSSLELRLTVRDSGGLAASTSVTLQPRTVALRLESDPPGLVLGANDTALAAPFTRTVIVGSSNTVSAPSPQAVGGVPYAFRSWSDGGAATHGLIAGAAETTLRATYRPLADLAVSIAAFPDPVVQAGRVTLTATVQNRGPANATGVELTSALPPGTALVASAGDPRCTPNAGSVRCALGSLGSGAVAALSLTLRPARAGLLSLDVGVSSDEADLPGTDNSVSRAVSVRPHGDLDGDGSVDLLWQYATSGHLAAWRMAGTTFGSAAVPTPDALPAASWRLGGIGDFDGDGRPDLLWRDQATGANAVWRMDGLARIAAVALPALADTAWQIAGVADFNADGWPDVLWRHQTLGVNYLTYLAGTASIGGTALPIVADTAWQIVGLADFNGDGGPDLLWRRPGDGLNYAWLMSGADVIAVPALPAVAGDDWRAAAVGDLDGDGKPDVVWRHAAAGFDYVWILDGVTPIGGALLPTVADPAWLLVGPR
jgi:uncharacterized repeat protein (TIGR01451 family)